MKSVAVFCGSSAGKNRAIQDATKVLARLLVRRDLSLVYGGGSTGLMGILADTALASGGKVMGVIPRAVARKEIVHPNLTELHVVESMRERKTMFMDLADGFILLPGGLGTLDEFVEVVSWAQLGMHKKPIGILNLCGYYDFLISQFERSVQEQFVWPEHRGFWQIHTDPEKLLDGFASYNAPVVSKWVQRDQL